MGESEKSPTFSKNKKVTKSHFRVLAYVYDVFGCSEGSESQSCVLSALERLGAPKSPKLHFFIRVRRFLRVLRAPKALLALLGCSELSRAPWGRDHLMNGDTELYDPGRAGSEGGAPVKSYHVCGSASIPPPLQQWVRNNVTKICMYLR